MSFDNAIKALSLDALKLVKDRYVIGLGSGRAATALVKSLSTLVKTKNLSIKCVPTSMQIKLIAEDGNLELIDADQINKIDIVFDGADSGPGVISYGELQSLTHRVANGLRNCGLQPGDSVAVFMPMTAESVAIYLGIITAGCVVVSIADSFSAEQLGVRLRVGNARLVFTVRSVNRGGKQIPIYDRVVDAAAPPAVLLDEDAREEQYSVYAVHDYATAFRRVIGETPPYIEESPVRHPNVREHPETGRIGLYVTDHACTLEGFPRAEGRAKIELLVDWCTREGRVYRHHWEAGDLIIWDNRSMLHRAQGFDSRQPLSLIHI